LEAQVNDFASRVEEIIGSHTRDTADGVFPFDGLVKEGNALLSSLKMITSRAKAVKEVKGRILEKLLETQSSINRVKKRKAKTATRPTTETRPPKRYDTGMWCLFSVSGKC
jgi:hypothetical protein